jgi:hypothetical protein
MSGDNEMSVSGWTVETLYQFLIARSELLAAALRQQVVDLGTSVTERFADMRVNLDERHVAQQAAVHSALVSAEKAVEKAEVAAEKRFESVNEFRQQLSDQAATFMSRTEVDAKLNALRDQTEVNGKRIAELELRLTSRLDTEQGSRAGGLDSRVEFQAEAASHRASNGQIMQFAGLVLLALAIVASVLVAVLH